MLWTDEKYAVTPSVGDVETEGRDFPTTAAETFAAAWSRNNLIGQNYSAEHDRFEVLTDYLNGIKARGGPDIAPQLDWGTGEYAPAAYGMLEQANAKLAKYKQQNPTSDIEPMSNDQFEQNALNKRRKADADYEAVMARPRGPGATIAAGVGGVLAGTADPINLVSMAIAPEAAVGLVKNFAQWGAFGLGVGGIEEALQAPHQEELYPGYIASGAPVANVLTGGLIAGVGGAGIHGLARVFDHMRGVPLPQTVRDAGNVVTSQANIAGSNVYPGLEGAVAHPQALSQTIDNVLARRPVDVSDHITPELDATAGAEPIQLAAARAARAQAEALRVPPPSPAPELPFERTAAEAQAEAARAPIDAAVQQRARQAQAPYEMPAEEAARVTNKMLNGTAEEAQDTLRNLQISPRQVADAPTRIDPDPEARPYPFISPKPIDPNDPTFQEAMRADLDRELVATARAYRQAGFSPHEATLLAAEHREPYAEGFWPAAPPGSVEELEQMNAQAARAAGDEKSALVDKMLEHPVVKKAIADAYGTHLPSSTPEQRADPNWRAGRVYEFTRPDGSVQKVQGADAALEGLAQSAKGFAGGAYKTERHAIIVVGPPAAGKSTIAEDLARQIGGAIVDPDETAKVVPGHAGGTGSGIVHEEAVMLARALAAKLGQEGGNMVLPKVGQRLDVIQDMIKEMKDSGYNVELVHTAVPIEESQRRNISRYLDGLRRNDGTARLVDPSYIAGIGSRPRENAYMLRGSVGDFADVDNLQRTVEGTGPLADRIRAGYERRAGDQGRFSGAQRGEARGPQAEPLAHAIPNHLAFYSPQDIGVDADRFQFKGGADEAGVTDRLKGVKTWDPIKAGQVLTWIDKDNKPWIVDGHQRLALAKRIAADDPSQSPQIEARVLREADGITPADARTIAALKNIAEGTGTAVDAAKVIRDNPERIDELPPRSELVRQARGLANLSPDAFRMVVNDVVPANYAAIVGRLVPADPTMQGALIRLLTKTDPANAVQAEAIARQGIEAGLAKSNAGAQATLFGDDEVAQSLYTERAKVLDRALKSLRKDETVFKTLVREQETVELAGNKLAADINEKRMVADGQALQIIQTLANRAGPISDALRTAAASARTDGYPAAVRQFVATVREAVSSGELTRAANGIERGATHVGEETTAGTIDRGFAAEPSQPDELDHAEHQYQLAAARAKRGPSISAEVGSFMRELEDVHAQIAARKELVTSVYQADEKAALARERGLPENAYYNLPYQDWLRVQRGEPTAAEANIARLKDEATAASKQLFDLHQRGASEAEIAKAETTRDRAEAALNAAEGPTPGLFEPGAEGLPQGIMPGMAPSARQLAAARAGPLRPGVPQAEPGGMFAPAAPAQSDMFPIGVDTNGNVSYRPLGDMVDELDQYKAAADQLASCAALAA